MRKTEKKQGMHRSSMNGSCSSPVSIGICLPLTDRTGNARLRYCLSPSLYILCGSEGQHCRRIASRVAHVLDQTVLRLILAPRLTPEPAQRECDLLTRQSAFPGQNLQLCQLLFCRIPDILAGYVSRAASNSDLRDDSCLQSVERVVKILFYAAGYG